MGTSNASVKPYTGLCKNIPAKFWESLSKCSAAHHKNALWRNISANRSQNLAGMCLHYSVHVMSTVHCWRATATALASLSFITHRRFFSKSHTYSHIRVLALHGRLVYRSISRLRQSLVRLCKVVEIGNVQNDSSSNPVAGQIVESSFYFTRNY